MKQLQILNAVLLASGASLGLVLAVVCLIYSLYLDAAPRLRLEMPALLTLTAGFMALALAGGLAFWGHRRNWNLRWWTQVSPIVPLLGIIFYLTSL